MIEQILLRGLPVEMGMNPAKIAVNQTVRATIFTLSDEKACKGCRKTPECNEETLRIDPHGQRVAVIKFEDYASQYGNTQNGFSERCDFLLYDPSESHGKIVFCDLTCSDDKWVEPNTGKYPEGKRAKARRQMLMSMEVLLRHEVLAVTILTFAQKVCLFGWREPTHPAKHMPPQRGRFMHNLLSFMATPSEMAQSISSEEHIMKHGFTFVQVKYPNVYEW